MYIFTDVMLLAWPVICIGFFLVTSPGRATLLSFLGSMLFLPMRTGYDLPGLPFVGKEEFATMGVLAGLLLVAPQKLTGARAGRGVDLVTVVLLGSAFATALVNGDPLTWGIREGTKLRAYDGLSYVIEDLLRFGIPFLIGHALFRTRRDMRDLLTFIGVAGLVYSIVAVIEMRMSPQFHDWVYGYHQSSFRNVYRLGGYRPMGFMWSGLAFSLFICTTALAMSTLARAKLPVLPIGPLAKLAVPYQTVILVLCRSSAAIGYGLATLPVLWFGRSRWVMRAAVLLCALVVAYPMLRALNLFPTDALVQLATSFSPKRAQSLEFRFDNEDRLLAKAMQRPLLGWGASGRARVYDEEDGDDITVTDGTWIIRLGMRGFIGWAATFGFLLVPVWMARRSLGRLSDERDRIQLAGLALILSVYAIDLLPNALFTNFPIFIGGAVCGISKSIARTKPARADRWRRRGGSAPASRPRDRAERLFAGDYTPGDPAPRRPRTTSTLTGGGYSDMLR